MDNEKILLSTLNYTISVDNYDEAFVEVLKKYTYPLHTVYTIVVALVAGYNGWMIYKNPTNNIHWLIIAISLAFIFTLWYNPIKRRKSLRQALSQLDDDSYVAEIYSDSIKITTVVEPDEETGETQEISPKIIFYETDEPHVIETENLFVIYIKKQMFYVIPKSFLSGEQKKLLRTELSDKAKKFYSTDKTN